MSDRVFTGKVQGKRLVLEDREKFAALVESLEGKHIEILLRKQRDIRSSQQNRYLWGVVYPHLADFLGYERDDIEVIHDACKVKFLSRIDPNGLTIARSTKHLDVREFAEYVDAIIRMAAELGCVIPGPNETL